MQRLSLIPLPHVPSAADRRALRRPAMIGVVVSSSALGHRAAQATNLSLAGCRIALQCRLVKNQFVMLTFPGLSPLGAHVAWSSGIATGVAFARPLAASVLDHLLGPTGR